MKRLVETAASRAWFGIALVGLVIVLLVLVLTLIPRLTKGQKVIDAAKPAFTDDRVAGLRAGTDFISRYVDLADPLVTPRGSLEAPKLVALIRRETGMSRAEVRRLLRRRAPHTEALLRALPLTKVSAEIPRFTEFLAKTLNVASEDLQIELVKRFPRLAQTLTALPNVTRGWRGVPGVEGRLTRFDGKPVRSVAQLRDYYRNDLVPIVAEHRDDVQYVGGWGGIGYIPWLLLVVGLAVLAYGLMQANRARVEAPGKRSWSVVAGVGVVIVLIVVALQYWPRLGAAQDTVDDFKPAFEAQRVDGTVAGIDMVGQTVRFGDPIATRKGGAVQEVPRLIAFVAGETGQRESQVLRAVRRVAPRTAALLDAVPLSAVAGEQPRLVALLARRLDIPRGRVLAALQKSVPGLAQSLVEVRPVALSWRRIPGTEKLTRFDGATPVSTMPQLVDYLREEVMPIFPEQRKNFDKLANTWPPLNVFAPLLLVVGLLVVAYGLLGMRVLARRY